MALTPYSWKIVTTANCSFAMPFEAPPVGIWNDTVGTPRTATIEGIWPGGAPPMDDECWVEVEYLNSNSSPQASFAADCKADLLATAAAQTASTVEWGGGGGGGLPPTTFDGTPSAGIVMSNGNLTVTHGTNNNTTGVQSKTELFGGRGYFEVLLQTSVSNTNGVGLKPYTAGAFSDSVSPNFTNGVGVALGPVSSTVRSNGVDSGKDLGPQAVGKTVCVAIDLNARLAWFRFNAGNWNGDAAANPVTGTGGVAFPTGGQAPCVRFTNGTATDAFTANFGATAFAFSPPTTFIGWNGWNSGRFKLSIPFTAQQKGFIYARVKCAKPSATFYIDPKVTLT